MKTAVLCGIAIVCSSAAFAQTQTPATASTQPSRAITLTGCVGGGTSAQPITLANAMVVPTGDVNAAASPSPVPGAASSGTTQPPSAAGATGTSGVAGATGGAAAGVGTPTAAGRRT